MLDQFRPFIDTPAPSADLSPAQVVAIQLDSLQNNDLIPDDEGIRAAFQFASPTNRAATGPVEHFIDLLKSALYRDLIGFERAELGPMFILGDVAQQRIRVVRKGEGVVFIFALTRQQDGYYDGCWMTDAVIRES